MGVSREEFKKITSVLNFLMYVSIGLSMVALFIVMFTPQHFEMIKILVPLAVILFLPSVIGSIILNIHSDD